MHYEAIFDKWHEECGVFGIYDTTVPISEYVYWGLFSLQHRGQESAGIAVANGETIEVVKGMGLVTEAFPKAIDLQGHIGIGHVRYATTGSANPKNIQPLAVQYHSGEIAVAHNGNLVNAVALRRALEAQGSIFQTSMDSEVIVNRIARSLKASIEERIQEALQGIEGAYSLVMCTTNALIGVRDPRGFRPLALGQTEQGGYILTSETCALQALGATFLRDIEPGEMVVIDAQGVHSNVLISSSDRPQKALCAFEYIYFARPDSRIDGQEVYEARMAMGRELAKETKYEADLVMSIPDSGTTAALGYAFESGIPFKEGLVKNRYMGRTFLKPTQEQRQRAVHMKLSPIYSVLKGKRVILVDDSIVRGTTSKIIVAMLREAGVREISLCVSAPPVAFSCYYGLDTSERQELIAATHSLEEIREFIGVDRLAFLSTEGLCRSIASIPDSDLCLACFTGHYETKLPRTCVGKWDLE